MDINSNTRIQLFAVLSAIPFVFGAIIWLTTIYATVAEAQRINQAQDEKIEQQTKLLLDIRERIIRIEATMPRGAK